MNDDAHSAAPRRVQLGNTTFHLLGTAHVSRQSAEDVRRELRSGRYDAVAIELCPSRYRALAEPGHMANMDLFQVLRQGKAGMVAANLALSAYQQRLAEQSGIQPGAEMLVGAERQICCDHARFS